MRYLVIRYPYFVVTDTLGDAKRILRYKDVRRIRIYGRYRGYVLYYVFPFISRNYVDLFLGGIPSILPIELVPEVFIRNAEKLNDKQFMSVVRNLVNVILNIDKIESHRVIPKMRWSERPRREKLPRFRVFTIWFHDFVRENRFGYKYYVPKPISRPLIIDLGLREHFVYAEFRKTLWLCHDEDIYSDRGMLCISIPTSFVNNTNEFMKTLIEAIEKKNVDADDIKRIVNAYDEARKKKNISIDVANLLKLVYETLFR